MKSELLPAMVLNARSMLARHCDELDEREETRWMIDDVDEIRALLSEIQEIVGNPS